MKVEIYEREPPGFSPRIQVAACYLEFDGKLLLLQKSSDKLEPGVWSVPAGKLEKNETPASAAVRELFEETGIRIESLDQIRFLGSLYIRKPEIDYVYHQFKIQIDRFLPIRLSEEHQNYKWASSDDLAEMPLMTGAQQVLHIYRKLTAHKGSKLG